MESSPFTAVGGEYLWLLRYPLLLWGAFCLMMAASNASRALFLWRHRNMQITDKLIAEALASTKPPRFGLRAAFWVAAAALCIAGAFVAVPT